MRVSLPPQLVERAREFSEGRRMPAEPRDAATVVLMRPGAAGPDAVLAAATGRDLTMFTPAVEPDATMSVPDRVVPLLEARRG